MAAIPSERQVVFLANVPNGEPVESDYEVRVTPLAAAGEDELVLETLYLSVDPYLRILMRGGDKVGYAQPFQKGDEILGYGVCRVLKGSGAFQQGDLVVSSVPWADYNVIKTSPGINKVPEGANPLTFLSAAGLTGLTAYFGILQVGALESLPQGSTVYVSGAAGATGNVVGQIAKIKGYRVVGSAGSEEKVNWLINDLGFDAAFNYKTSEDYVSSLRQVAPNGIDLYFDNVGGEMFDAVLKVINDRGVIVNCGAISLYNSSGVVLGPRVETFLVLKQLRMQGMLVFNFVSQYPTAVKEIFGWIEQGKLKDRVTVFPDHGISSVARGFIEMLKGTNIGKMVVKVKDE